MGQVSRLRKNLEVRDDLAERGGGPFQSGKESESCNILILLSVPLSDWYDNESITSQSLRLICEREGVKWTFCVLWNFLFFFFHFCVASVVGHSYCKQVFKDERAKGGGRRKLFVHREGKEEAKKGRGQVNRGRRRRGEDEQPQKDEKEEEKKINLLLFWTDTQKI